MPKTEAKCGKCGRPKASARHVAQRIHEKRFRYYRCECGQEWTEVDAVVDVAEPVSSDEVIDVHQKLAKFEGSLTDLLSE